MDFEKLVRTRSYWSAVLGAGVVAVGAISALACDQSHHWGYGAKNGAATLSTLGSAYAVHGSTRAWTPTGPRTR